MSVGEYMELIVMMQDSGGFHAMNAMAILFAYLTAAYLAASKLTRIQLAIATGLYSIFYFFPAFSSVRTMENLFRLGGNFNADYPSEAAKLVDMPALAQASAFINTATFAYVIAWVAGIIFMVASRRKK